MKAPFDHIAETYDSHFTNSSIGQFQRQVVWRYLEKVIPGLNGLEMLELNCGTGEDAVLFGSRGFNIVATDISREMLRVADKKAKQFSMQHRISSRYLDLESFDETFFEKKFDLVFSNFGGLNCVRPESIKRLLEKIPSILTPGGRLIAVIMPKFCLWENLYFAAKFRFSRAFQRNSNNEVIANLHGEELSIWHYSPDEIKKWSFDKFQCLNTQPVGITLPPSYLETFFTNKKRLLASLNSIERKVSGLSFLSGMSDHFLIDLKLR
jgi:ubiquinone/menaquinone biosynthesis C-methylase UbiE